MTVFHLADTAEWAAARESGFYARSTRGLSLAEVGFIHLSTDEQWPRVRVAFYGDVDGELVLLEIDDDRLAESLVWEVGEPGQQELFPHLYGALPIAAVVSVTRLAPPHGST